MYEELKMLEMRGRIVSSAEQIINSAIDIFGYSESDFFGMSYEEILEYLDEEMPEIIEYCLNKEFSK